MRERMQGKLTANEAKWAERLRRLEKSGLTRQEFAAREGVSPNAISWWRWTLRRQQEQAQRLQFVELKAPAAGEDEKAAAGGFEVVLVRGRVVRVRPGFDARELLRLVTALEEVQP
jgi:hypothetical protein